MTLAHRTLCFLACCFTLILPGLAPLPAQAPSGAPFHLAEAFSAVQTLTTKEGANLTYKIYMDGGKIRNEMAGPGGLGMVTVILPDEQKVYSFMPQQKMAMALPYDPAKMKERLAKYSAASADFQPAGSDTVNGVACNKYVGTTKDKAITLWVNAAGNVPVKMAADDGSFSILWKDYKPGPQDPSLFAVPSDYHVMTMPAMPSVPAGPPPGAPALPPPGQ